MSVVSRLIDVQYTDLTNYNVDAGADILGLPFYYHWGPIGQLQVLNETQFFQQFPENLPSGIEFDAQSYYAYASIKKAFESGANLVEVVRVPGGCKCAGYMIESSGAFTEMTQVVTPSKTFTGAFRITTKYPGIPPQRLTGVCDTVVCEVTQQSAVAGNNVITIKVYSANYVSSTTTGAIQLVNDEYVKLLNLLETFTGSLNQNAVDDNGSSVFIKNVVNSSEFINVDVNAGVNTTVDDPAYIPIVAAIDDTSLSDLTQAYDDALQLFNDGLNSQATMLMSPLSGAFASDLINIAKQRQDCNAAVGFSTANPFTEAKIAEVVGYLPHDKFSAFVAGREMYSVFGQDIVLDCVAGWVGATFNIAQAVRTNQLASAFTYGRYNGVLTESLTFDEVADLMELGVISVFNSINGPLIWGVHSLNANQNSYWGKLNVSRVLARILRQVFPIALEAVHTDAAANDITNMKFNTRFNAVVNDEVANQNLKSDSYVNTLGEINNDYNTKGGKIYNIDLSLHFIGLVESIKIRVYATDSSVTSNIQ